MKKNDVKLQTKVNNDLLTEREQQYRQIIKRHRAAWLILFIAAIAPTDYSLAHQLIWLHYIFVALFAATTIYGLLASSVKSTTSSQKLINEDKKHPAKLAECGNG